MTLQDFHVGQIVCLYIIEGSNRRRRLAREDRDNPEKIFIDGTVESVGKKYVTVNGHRFDSKNDFIHDNDGTADYELFLSRADAEKDHKRNEEYRKALANFNKYGKNIGYEDIAAINAIIDKYV